MKKIFPILLVQIVFGCFTYPDQVQMALELADDNRPELKKVLDHYADNDQQALTPLSLKKLKAAEYLIQYMLYYNYDAILPQFEPVWDTMALHTTGDEAERKLLYLTLLISITDKGGTRPGAVRYDIREITAEELIENIDLAFEAWQEIPEKGRADFQTFLDYILPYRSYDEPLEPHARKYLKEKYSWIPEMLHQMVSPKQVLDSLSIRFNYRFTLEIRDYYPTALSVLQMDRSRHGLCQDAVTYFVNVLRSVGIPCANEYVPQYGNHHYKGHSWLWAKYGEEEFAFDAGGSRRDVREKYIGESVPKVYRRTYSQTDPTSLFRDGRDVTSFYMPVIDFELKSDIIPADTSDLYTVNVYHRDKGWSPVAEMEWVPDDEGKEYRLICRDLGVNAVYVAGRYENGVIYPVTVPFYVNMEGDIHEFRPEKTLLDSIKLLRKFGLSYPRSNKKVRWMEYLNGSTIQGANNPDFVRADTLLKVQNFRSTHLQRYSVRSNRPYRYVRFASATFSAFLAELAFYNHRGQKLEGHLISQNLIAGTQDSAIIDGNPLTWTGGKDIYIGIAFDRPQVISEVSIQVRNDDNHIRIGDEYELQYWDREWKGLGTQVAQDTVLYYNDVPKNALLILRNHTRGSEEIPFSLNEEKEQVWLGFDAY